MDDSIPSHALLEQASLALERSLGIHFPPDRRRDMLRGLETAARELGLAETDDLARRLTSGGLDPKELEALVGSLTIGETYFFRESRTMEVLEKDVLPRLLGARAASGQRSLRIWSAGCCTGEEPYSLAILLDRLLPDRKDWDLHILATDLNPRFLARARRGVYREWSFRGTPDWVRRNYFERLPGGEWRVCDRVRGLVRFETLNLAADPYPSLLNHTAAQDLILCRNVLMYFSPDRATEAVERLHRCLVEDSVFFTSSSEGGLISQTGLFRAVSTEGCTYFQRGGSTTDSAPPAPPTERLVNMDQTPPALPAPRPAASKPTRQKRRAPEVVPVLDAAEDAAPTDDMGIPPAARARSLAGQGRLEEARESCLAAIEGDRLDPSLRYLLATILIEQNRPDEAEAALRRTLYLAPDLAVAHFSLAMLLGRRGSPDAARSLDNALDMLNPLAADAEVPESEGLTARELRELIENARGGLA